MATQGTPSNVDKLRDAGVIDDSLPTPYHSVFENLTDQETEAILDVKKRLDEVTLEFPGVEHYRGFVPF